MQSIGNRVGAIISVDTGEKIVMFAGYGKYKGDEIPQKE